MSDNPDRVPNFRRQLSGPSVMTQDELFSVYVSRALDCLGKSDGMVNFRINMVKAEQTMINSYSQIAPENIYAGSKAEGLTCIMESDYDTMLVLRNVICADNSDEVLNTVSITVFQTERGDTCPGYTQLRLIQIEQGPMRVLFHEVSNGDNTCIDNNYIINKLKPLLTVCYSMLGFEIQPKTGPSMPLSGFGDVFNYDAVFSFVCVCPDILQSFLRRRRFYNWPSREQLTKISEMDSHVVPVGFKGSEFAHKEWRICYTKAEAFLVQNLNNTQRKLYILLKMVAKDIIKRVSNDISSYIMKNIVLWMAECYSHELLTENKLIDRLMQALFLLRHCISNNCLSSYMIPERNLLAGKLDPAQRRTLVALLTFLLEEGGHVLLRCEKLRTTLITLYTEPTKAMDLCHRRDKIEKLAFCISYIYLYKMFDNLSTEETELAIYLQAKCATEMQEYGLIKFPSLQEQLDCAIGFGHIRSLEDLSLVIKEFAKHVFS